MNEWINERIASAVSEVRSWMSSDVGLLRHWPMAPPCGKVLNYIFIC